MVHILITNTQHCNKQCKLWKKEQTRKRKETNNTKKNFKKSVSTKSAKPKFDRIVKLAKTKQAKGQQRKKNKHVRKMNFHDHLHK